jgi:hypothetical protein
VIEPPLRSLRLVLVGGDPLPHHELTGLDHNVHNFVPER